MIVLRCDRCDKEGASLIRLTSTYVVSGTEKTGKPPQPKDLCPDCYKGYMAYCSEDRERRRAEAPTFDRT